MRLPRIEPATSRDKVRHGTNHCTTEPFVVPISINIRSGTPSRDFRQRPSSHRLRATSLAFCFLPHRTPCPTPPPSPTTTAATTPAPTTTVTTTMVVTATPASRRGRRHRRRWRTNDAEVIAPTMGRCPRTRTAMTGVTWTTRVTASGSEVRGKCRPIPLAVTHRHSYPCSSGTSRPDPHGAELGPPRYVPHPPLLSLTPHTAHPTPPPTDRTASRSYRAPPLSMPRHHPGAATHPCTPENARRAYSTAGTRAHVLSLPGHAAAACLLRRRVPDARCAAVCFVTPLCDCYAARCAPFTPPFARYAAVYTLRRRLPVTPPFTRYAAVRPLCRR